MRCINLDDANVVMMDEDTGNIIINFEDLGGYIEEGDTLCIHFNEDPEAITHEYKVTKVDEYNEVVALNWVRQLGESLLKESLLTEAPSRMEKKIAAGNKKAAKYDKKLDAKFASLIKREIANGKKQGLKFYLQLPNGNMMKNPLDFSDISGFYSDSNNLNPAIVNAIVTTPDKTIIRKGKQDYAKQNVKYSTLEAKVPSNVSITWDEGSKARFKEIVSAGTPTLQDAVKQASGKGSKSTGKTSKKSTTETEDEITTTKKTKTGTGENSAGNSHEKRTEGEQGSPKKKNNSDEQSSSADSNASEENNATEKKEDGSETSGKSPDPVTSSNEPYSVRSLQHFLKFLHVMKPEIRTKDGKRLDNRVALEQIQTGAKLDELYIMVSGTPYTIDAFIPYAVKSGMLNESLLVEEPVIKLDDADLVEPNEVNFRDKIRRGLEQERIDAENKAKQEKAAELRAKYSGLIDKVTSADKTIDALEVLYDALVPSSGPAETVAGEFVRAIMRILYRDWNDGDKFFTGYGLETCGGSAQYLAENGFHIQIQRILDRAYQLADDDTKYTEAITDLAKDIIVEIKENPELLETINEEDSRDYSYADIEESQPRYEFEIPGSDDIDTLVEKGVLTSWDLVGYVNDMLSYESVYEGCNVARPWSHHDTSVTVEELTKDGVEYLEEMVRRNLDGFWEDLVSEHADELDDDFDEEE